jgi:Sec-independent protein translocase protein TatA
MFLGEIFGPDLLIVIIVLAVLLFGGAAIPKLAKSLGSAKSEFENGLKATKSAKAEVGATFSEMKSLDTSS